MIIKRRSPFSGFVNYMDLDVTQEQLNRYLRGEGLVQEIFPDLGADAREFIMTGITPDEWAVLAGETE